MNRIGIIGDADSVLGFKAFGIDAFACNSSGEAAKTLGRIVKEDYGIIFIIENIAKEIEDEIVKYEDLRIPAIISIPGIGSDGGTGIEHVKRAVVQAVGADILFGDE